MFPSLTTGVGLLRSPIREKSKAGRPSNASKIRNLEQNSNIYSLPAIVRSYNNHFYYQDQNKSSTLLLNFYYVQIYNQASAKIKKYKS